MSFCDMHSSFGFVFVFFSPLSEALWEYFMRVDA